MKIWFFLFPIMAILSLWACSSPALPEGKKISQDSAATIETQIPLQPKESWQVEWDRVLAKAKKEGAVSVMGTSAETGDAIISAFNKRYGIKVEWIIGKSAQLAEKLITEQRVGIYLWDVHVGGSTTKVNVMKPAGVFASLGSVFIRPDILEPQNWYPGQPAFLDKAREIVQIEYSVSGDLGINTNLVKSGEIKFLRDLLNPRWKGKIIINDPTISGTGAKFVGVAATLYGWDIWREIARQEPVILRDENLMILWLAQGKYAIVTAPKTERIQTALTAGAPVANIGLEDMAYSTGSSVSLIKNAPHPNAATVFINWILSQEGQTVFGRASGKSSARKDVVLEDIVTSKPKPGVEYFKSDAEDFILQQPAQMRMSLEIFGPLMK